MTQDNRRNRSDSASSAVQFVADESTPIEPPAHVELRDEDWPHWWAIVRAKRRESWTEHDLIFAAELARNFADLNRLRRELADEGDIVGGVINPKRKIEGDLIARSIRLTRLLQIHPLATQGRSADQAKRNTRAREAADAAADDLIAGPRRH